MIYFSENTYKVCFNKDYFYHSTHLNQALAEVFSLDLADSINKYYH